MRTVDTAVVGELKSSDLNRIFSSWVCQFLSTHLETPYGPESIIRPSSGFEIRIITFPILADSLLRVDRIKPPNEHPKNPKYYIVCIGGWLPHIFLGASAESGVAR